MSAPPVSAGVQAAVWDALATVTDPELDQPVTTLGFVAACSVQDGVATVRLRLPTFFCAPNFAWLMVADAHQAVAAVPGVTTADVALEDYFAAEDINTGVAAGHTFTATFADLADGELDELRLTFWRKAYTAALDRVCQRLTGDGTTQERLAATTLADVPPCADRDRLIRHRRNLGLPTAGGDRLLIDDTGQAIPREEVATWLRRAQTVRVSLEGNAHLCQGLLRTRYHLQELEEQLGLRG